MLKLWETRKELWLPLQVRWSLEHFEERTGCCVENRLRGAEVSTEKQPCGSCCGNPGDRVVAGTRPTVEVVRSRWMKGALS